MSVNLSLIRYLLPDDEREEDELDARPAEPELKLPEERPAELGLKLLLEELLEEDLPELKLPDDRPVELLPVLKLPLERSFRMNRTSGRKSCNCCGKSRSIYRYCGFRKICRGFGSCYPSNVLCSY